jgi:hypothetical protein
MYGHRKDITTLWMLIIPVTTGYSGGAMNEINGHLMQLFQDQLPRRIWSRCPFHEEDTPSFHIDLKKMRWYCYGCSKGGTLEDLKKEMETETIIAGIVL